MPMRSLRKTDFLYISFILLSASFLLTCCIVCLYFDYEQLLQRIIFVLHKKELEPLLRNQVFTHQKYILIGKICFGGLILIPAIDFLAINFKSKISDFLFFTLECIRNL